jgi:hypothetical protein
MRTPILLAALAAALTLPAAAAAKGPDRATISGPGLSGAVPVTGQGESGTGTPLGDLVQYTSWFGGAWGAEPDPRLAGRPSGDLGPRYTVVYRVPGPPSKPDHILQYLYPYATPVAVAYMPSGQRFWVTQRTRGGWFRADPKLKPTLVRLGLPANAPSTGGGFPWRTVTIALAGAFVLVLAALVVRRIRPWTAHSTSSTAGPSA